MATLVVQQDRTNLRTFVEVHIPISFLPVFVGRGVVEPFFFESQKGAARMRLLPVSADLFVDWYLWQF